MALLKCNVCGNTVELLRKEEETKEILIKYDFSPEIGVGLEPKYRTEYTIYQVVRCNKCNMTTRELIGTFSEYEKEKMERIERTEREKEEAEKWKAFIKTPEGKQVAQRKEEERQKAHEEYETSRKKSHYMGLIDSYRQKTAELKYIIDHPHYIQGYDDYKCYQYDKIYERKEISLKELEDEYKKELAEYETTVKIQEEQKKQKYEKFESFQNGIFNKAMRYLSNFPWG